MLSPGPFAFATSFAAVLAILLAVLAAVSSGLRLLPVLGLGVLKRHVGDRNLLRMGSLSSPRHRPEGCRSHRRRQ